MSGNLVGDFLYFVTEHEEEMRSARRTNNLEEDMCTISPFLEVFPFFPFSLLHQL